MNIEGLKWNKEPLEGPMPFCMNNGKAEPTGFDSFEISKLSDIPAEF